MALEINEIGIRMRVRDSASEAAQAKRTTRDGCDDVDREEIVDDVVRRVIKILATLQER